MDPETSFFLHEYVGLYNKAPKIQRMKIIPRNEEQRVFLLKSGNPVAIVSTVDHRDLLPVYVPFFEFYKSTKLFWMVPCDLPDGSISGFVLRSLHGKNYMRFQVKEGPPLLFGLHNFGSFKVGDPIVLAEGAKDALYLSQFYPFVIAALTNYVSDFTCDLLSRLTKKVVVAWDNDASGNKSVGFTVKSLSKHGVVSVPIYPSWGRKDWAECSASESLGGAVKLLLDSAFKRFGGRS